MKMSTRVLLVRDTRGCAKVISDYVPKATAPAARVGLLGVTCLTMAGMLKLNMQGEGVTKTAKRLWKSSE